MARPPDRLGDVVEDIERSMELTYRGRPTAAPIAAAGDAWRGMAPNLGGRGPSEKQRFRCFVIAG